ncbi:hypothetical protein VTN96DRAFT_8377 [Rasamsonia emersonii]|uniref:DUF7053 domain-containing protein n=1 Tax=Rasamsonia emersonii (strain ATCC 16479 / CBS 393.64 / IMI 116815) TaxID=1408163 RepID=A0A0F4YYM5_RASE3|nr:hypothetical protein T310_3053 [Rasamsonia emersonii CBS 393.64]KKA22946.1 hypothetical protein T310_3053 [Rasamsonia emersonii CBS 393.64]
MKKKEVYTNVTPLPSFIPRQLAIDILHSHSEIITLNPLVLEHHPIPAPRDAPADEYYSTWYEITERIQYVPGLGKIGSGKISFRGCFHDVPWGLQTHIYAPLGVDLRNNWRVAGNQPGEPPEPRELGIGAPADGLYLREDIEIKCNVTLVSFVKAQLKASTKVLVDRLIKKAELLDAGMLQAMMDNNGKLKTINPADRSEESKQRQRQLLQRSQSISSQGLQYPASPTVGDYNRPGTAGEHTPLQYRSIMSPGPIAMELPGDMHYHQQQQQSPYSPKQTMFLSSDRSDSNNTASSSVWSSDYQQWLSSRPTSYSCSDTSGFRSPGLGVGIDQKTYFAAELPAMSESREEQAAMPKPKPLDVKSASGRDRRLSSR